MPFRCSVLHIYSYYHSPNLISQQVFSIYTLNHSCFPHPFCPISTLAFAKACLDCCTNLKMASYFCASSNCTMANGFLSRYSSLNLNVRQTETKKKISNKNCSLQPKNWLRGQPSGTEIFRQCHSSPAKQKQKQTNK